MDDIFYFSAANINLADIECVLKKDTNYLFYLTQDHTALQITANNSEQIQVFIMNLDEFDEISLNAISEHGDAKFIMCISFHCWSCKFLVQILASILKHFSGWVGSDTEKFEPIFTLENIDQLGDYMK